MVSLADVLEDIRRFQDSEFTDTFSNTFLSWQRVEAQLFLIFNTLLPTKSPSLVSAAFHAVISLDARLAMITAVAHNQFRLKLLSEYEEEWDKLAVKVKKLARQRNYLAHFSLHRHTAGNKSSLRLRPSIFDVRPSKKDYGLKELKQFGSGFSKLEEKLSEFNVKVRRVIPR